MTEANFPLSRIWFRNRCNLENWR